MRLDFNEMMTLAENKKELAAKREVVDGVPVVIFAYNVAFSDTFDSELAKEFRGTTFREDTKELISRPFPKFFNVGERADSGYDSINWRTARFYTKHDGSMAVPVLLNGKIFWRTKKSFYSDVAKKIQSFYDTGNVKGLASDRYFHKMLEDYTYTPIFEYVGPTNQIVLPYETESLEYLGFRENHTGKFNPCEQTEVNGLTYNQIYEMKDIEGFVIHDGEKMVKAKTKFYLDRHRIVTDFNPKNIIQLTLDNKIDDVLGVISQLGMTLRFHQVSQLRDETLEEYFTTLGSAEKYYKTLHKTFPSMENRKEFALAVNEHIPKEYRSAMFALKDGKNIQSIVDKIVFAKMLEKFV